MYAANRAKVIEIDLDLKIQTVMYCIAFAEGTTQDQYQRKLVTVRLFQEQSSDPTATGFNTDIGK